jgi:nitrate/TMAO reductase-like tetraheme cytochrome c subunit
VCRPLASAPRLLCEQGCGGEKKGFEPEDLDERGKWLLGETDKEKADGNQGGVAQKLPWRKVNAVEWLAGFLGFLFPSVAAAQEGVPLPRGWIGTSGQWLHGLGIAFALLNLVLLAFAWRSLRGGTITGTTRGWLFVSVGLLPVMVAFLSFAYGLETSATVSACGSCHAMTPFVRDLQDVNSDTLAATHFKNRYIREKQCYTCHSDYGLGGTIKAKTEGLGHVWRSATGLYTTPIKIIQPFSNTRCLGCHAESQKFLNSDGHPKESMHDLMDGAVSCIECHGPAHPEQKEARR